MNGVVGALIVGWLVLAICGCRPQQKATVVPPVASCQKEVARNELSPRQQVAAAGALDLRVEAAATEGPAPAYVRLSLRNIGNESLWVNARMALGPTDYPNKEIWIEATNVVTGEKREQKYCSAKQAPSGLHDYLVLPPGAEYAIVRPLSCFQFPSSGPWKLVAHYQDVRQKPFEPPDDVPWFSGMLTSNPIEMSVKAR